MLIAVVAVVLVAGVVAWLSLRSSGSPSATTVERTVAVTDGPLRQTVTASGTLRPANTSELNFAVSGKVTAVNASAGQKVAKADVLATVDSAALQSAVAQAQATVDTAQAHLSTDTGNGATTAQLDADAANVTAAQASLASAQASLAGASLASPIDGTVASVNLTVGQQLGSSGSSASSLTGSSTGSGQTRAPSSTNSAAGGAGGGGGSSATTGSTAAASSSSSTGEIQVISTDSYVVDLGVDDTQIGRIAAGQQATVTLSSSPVGNAGGGGVGGFGGGGGFGGARAAAAGQARGTAGSTPTAGPGGDASGAAAAGTVTSVGVIATSTSGVATFPVVVTVTGNPTGFHAGATASVAITYQELPDVVQVPIAALTRTSGQATVTVLANGKKSSRPVVTGITAGGQVQVTSGLASGDQVIVSIPVAGRTGGGTGNGGGGGTGTRGTGNGGGTGARTFGGGG